MISHNDVFAINVVPDSRFYLLEIFLYLVSSADRDCPCCPLMSLNSNRDPAFTHGRAWLSLYLLCGVKSDLFSRQWIVVFNSMKAFTIAAAYYVTERSMDNSVIEWTTLPTTNISDNNT